MGFSDAVRTCLQEKYATFSGRASRSEYWYFMLFYFVVALVLTGLFLLLGGTETIETGEISPLAWLPIGLLAVFGLGMIVPMISAAVRRFHDRNLSGWWYLGVILGGMIPVVGIVASIAGFVITVLKGTPGPNNFGRDPLGADTSADVFT